jgi:hypothetical protein
VVDREYVRFGSWPLQILTDATPLIGEAIKRAVDVEFDGIPTRVFRAEHLCAVAFADRKSEGLPSREYVSGAGRRGRERVARGRAALRIGRQAGETARSEIGAMMEVVDEKTAFNVRAKASMQEFLRSKSWVEKVESIERMNAAGKLAREAMRKAMGEQSADGESLISSSQS